MCLIPCVSSQSCNTSSPRTGDLLENPDKNRDPKLEKLTVHGQKLKKPSYFNVVKITGRSSLILIVKKMSISAPWSPPVGEIGSFRGSKA